MGKLGTGVSGDCNGWVNGVVKQRQRGPSNPWPQSPTAAEEADACVLRGLDLSFLTKVSQLHAFPHTTHRAEQNEELSSYLHS